MTTDSVGTVGEEASRLLAAAETWWRESHTGADPAAAGSAGHGGPECRLCPLCQLMSAVRSTSPEVFEHLSSAALSLLSAARAAVEGRSAATSRPPGSRVERIDIR